LLKKGVEVFSISGSKGRKIASEEDWESEEYKESRKCPLSSRISDVYNQTWF